MAETEKVLFVYIGRRVNPSDGKLRYLWRKLDESDNEALQWLKQLIPAQPGNVFKFTRFHIPDKPDTYSISKAKTGENAPEFLHNWKDQVDVQRWQIADGVAFAADRKKSWEKRESKKLVLLEERLMPFRKAYWEARTKAEQRLILAMVNEIITKPLR